MNRVVARDVTAGRCDGEGCPLWSFPNCDDAEAPLTRIGGVKKAIRELVTSPSAAHERFVLQRFPTRGHGTTKVTCDSGYSQSTTPFGGGPTLFVGSFLRDVQVVDLDLDGHPDIVAVNQDGGFCGVFENLGGATFGPMTIVPVGVQPDCVTAADFNGDGFPDLVAANRALCDTADAGIALQIPGPPPPACPADLDGDGIVGAPDLAVMLATWGPAPGHPADLDDDGAVGPADLAGLLAAWGPCA